MLGRHSLRRSLNLLAAIAVLVLVLYGAYACGFVGSGIRAKRLHDQARSLLPAGATILLRSDGQCVMFAAEPSCVTVWFEVGGTTYAERERLFRDRIRATGWRVADESRGPGGLFLRVERGGYHGRVSLTVDEILRSCRGSVETCREDLQVVRD